MAAKKLSQYKAEYSDKNYDRYTILFKKGEKEVFKRAAALSNKSLNAYMIDLAAAEANKILAHELDTIRNLAYSAEEEKPQASNIVVYIESTVPSEFPPEPLRISILNLENGAEIYKGIYKTIYSSEGDEMDNAFLPTEEDIGILKGYLNQCDNIYTFDMERLNSLETGWCLSIDEDRVRTIAESDKSLMKTLGLSDEERELSPKFIALQLRDYIRKNL